MSASIQPELNIVESSLCSLAKAIERKTISKELRQEYFTLLQQATLALNKLRGISETEDFLRGFGSSSIGER